MKHHLFSMETCVHDPKLAVFVRAKLTEIREALGDDLHVFRMTETHQTIDKEAPEDADVESQTASNVSRLMS